MSVSDPLWYVVFPALVALFGFVGSAIGVLISRRTKGPGEENLAEPGPLWELLSDSNESGANTAETDPTIEGTKDRSGAFPGAANSGDDESTSGVECVDVESRAGEILNGSGEVAREEEGRPARATVVVGREGLGPQAKELSPAALIDARIVGVGGAGINAVDHMIEAGLEGVSFFAVSPDLQALMASGAHNKIDLHQRPTSPALRATQNQSDEDRQRLREAVEGADFVFIAVGEGGETGTEVAPVIAKMAKEGGALAIGVATRPFAFEGRRRAANADRGIESLNEVANTLIVVENDRLLDIADPSSSIVDSFRLADDVLVSTVKGITDILVTPGLIEIDVGQLRDLLSNMGRAVVGLGTAKGEIRARQAAERALSSPLLAGSIEGSQAAVISITGPPTMTLHEVNEAARVISDRLDLEAEIAFGATVDDAIGDAMRVSLIAAVGLRPGTVRR